MKVAASERSRSGNILGIRKESRRCMMNAAAVARSNIEHAGLSEEMNECLVQLSDMVPHVPRNEKGNIEAAVLIQYVIDYITDLSQQLGGQYPFLTSSASLLRSSASSLHCGVEAREPLSEKTLDNIVSCQSPRSPSSVSSQDFDSRPPSK